MGSPQTPSSFHVLLSPAGLHKLIEDTEEEKQKEEEEVEEEQGQAWSCRDTLRCPCGSPVEEECCPGEELCHEQDQEEV